MENTRKRCHTCSILTIRKTICCSSISFVECEQVNVYKVVEAHFKVYRFISHYTQYFACTHFFARECYFMRRGILVTVIRIKISLHYYPIHNSITDGTKQRLKIDAIGFCSLAFSKGIIILKYEGLLKSVWHVQIYSIQFLELKKLIQAISIDTFKKLNLRKYTHLLYKCDVLLLFKSRFFLTKYFSSVIL